MKSKGIINNSKSQLVNLMVADNYQLSQLGGWSTEVWPLALSHPVFLPSHPHASYELNPSRDVNLRWNQVCAHFLTCRRTFGPDSSRHSTARPLTFSGPVKRGPKRGFSLSLSPPSTFTPSRFISIFSLSPTREKNRLQSFRRPHMLDL